VPTPNTRNDEAGIKRKPQVWTQRIVFAFFIFIGLVVLLESPLTRIRQITVAGNRTISAATIIKSAGLHTGMSLWQVNDGAVKQHVVSHQPLIQNVDVQIHALTGTVNLTIQQKSVVALLHWKNAYYQLLNDGTVYAKAPTYTEAALPYVTVNGLTALTVGEIPSFIGLVPLCQQLSQLNVGELAGVSQIVLNSYGIATVYLENGFGVQVEAVKFAVVMGQIQAVLQYFISRGYGPGLIDMSGQPPYRYTPFQQAKQGGRK